jgi:HAD superfamily hydrolase (TIGR01549 family)/HAD superfamily hydrolase (TIGR01509 family)
MAPTDTSFRYDAVIFDVGGTLIGFPNWSPFQQFLADAGLPAAEEDARTFHSRFLAVMAAEREGAKGVGVEETKLEAWWHLVFKKTWPGHPDLAQEMLRWLRTDRFDRIQPDSLTALEALRAMKMRMGVLSNYTADLEDMLRRIGLHDYFEFVIVSSVVGLAKPDPRIFDLAVAKLQRPRHRLLYVGDYMGDDIEGARGAGLDAVLIDRNNRFPEAPCPRIKSLQALVPYVRGPQRPASAIIFDMDGVVLDSLATHLLSWQQVLAPMGIDLSAKALYPLEGMPTEVIAKRLTEQLLGEACSDADARRLADAKRSSFRHLFEPAFIPGIIPLLHDLRGRGYRLGLVTGSSRSVVDDNLDQDGVINLFDAIVSGDQVSQGKPHPEPYRMAAARLGSPTARCLVVENSLLGIQSAKSAGMQCAALETSLPAELLSAADRVFSDVKVLHAWLLAEWDDSAAM